MSDKEDNIPPKKSIPDLKNVLAMPVPEPKVKKDKGPKAKDINHTVMQAMIGVTHGWPAFPVTLHKIEDDRGETMTFMEKDGLVRELAENAVDSLISHYWRETLLSGPRPISLGALEAKDAANIRKLWLISARARKNDFPLAVWASDPRPAHHRLPFDPIPVDQLQNAAPLFAELMARTTNASGFMSWIGSLLDDRSQRQQYVWMHGAGGQGKGALMRALSSVFGNSVSSEQPPNAADKFWTWGLLGKRFVIFPDCNNSSFVTSGLFKTLTGEDRVRIERKGGAIFSAELPCKYLFVSNNKPHLSSQASDMRRVIFCGVGPITGHVDRYEERLKAEVPAIMSACWWAYLAETGGNPRGLYPIENKGEIEELAADSEHEYESFVDQYVGFCNNNPSIPDSKKPYVTTGDMKEEMIRAGFKDDYQRRRLREYLASTHDIKTTLVKFADGYNPSVRRVFLNIKLNKRVM